MRVAVALSGGVDSATAAALLLEEGHEVIGLTMRLWHTEEGLSRKKTCCAPEDLHDARRVAETLGIPFYVIDFQNHFLNHVVGDFIRSYQRGRTPNPCVRCNQILKFDLLLTRALELGADYLATGHYLSRRPDDQGRMALWRGADLHKDQSYFLFTITADQLKHLLFPMGALRKSEETRLLAERYGLHVAKKRESQDLCFVPHDGYGTFFNQFEGRAFTPGAIVNLSGEILGEHKGVGRYTVGQRRGLGIASDEPLYVIAIDSENNTLIAGPEKALYRNRLTVSDLNWIHDGPVEGAIEARIRSAAQPQPARIRRSLKSDGHSTDGHSTETVEVLFDRPQRAITPGQACVFYKNSRLLGGGWINHYRESYAF